MESERNVSQIKHNKNHKITHPLSYLFTIEGKEGYAAKAVARVVAVK